MPIEDFSAGVRVKDESGAEVGKLTGASIQSSAGPMVVIRNDDGVYSFVPSGEVRDTYDVADEPVADEPAATPDGTDADTQRQASAFTAPTNDGR